MTNANTKQRLESGRIRGRDQARSRLHNEPGNMR
jgi:hypothetical protein